MAALSVFRFGFGAFGIAFSVLVLAGLVIVRRMCLRADRDGVTVVNYFTPQRVPWTDITDFRLSRLGRMTTCLDVCRRDGTRVHARVVTVTGKAALSFDEADAILRDLRVRLLEATGEALEHLDARAIQDALAAADQGHYEQARRLVVEGRIDAEELAHRLVERHETSARTS